MKTALKTVLLTAFASILCLNLSAQHHGRKGKMTTEERAVKQTERMEKELDLTKEQKEKIKEINLQFAKQMEEQRSQEKKERKEKAVEIKAQKEAKEKALKEVLTEEQYTKWEERKAKMKMKREERVKLSKEDAPKRHTKARKEECQKIEE